MASFSANLGTIWYWGSQSFPVSGTIYGDTSRSGNTITLSNMSVALTWPGSAYGNWPVSITVANSTTSWNPLNVNTPSVGLNNASISVGTTDTSANVSWSSSDGYSGSFSVSFPAGSTPPTGLQCELVSQTWNSITLRGKVADWGSGSSDFSRHFSIMDGNSSGSTWLGRIEKYIDGNSTDWETVVISNSTADATLDGGINLIGQTFYKYGLWAGTNENDGKTNASDLNHTPTAPIETLSLTKIATTTGYDVTIAITGGDNTKNSDYNSCNWYRYSLDNGKTWSIPVRGSNDARPWITKTFTVNVPKAHKITVEARQGYYDMDSWNGYGHSETKRAELVLKPALYGSVEGVSKEVKTLYGPVSGQSKKIIKLYASVNGQSKLIYKE